MVAVGVGDQEVAYSLAGQGGEDGVHVLGQGGARVDHGDTTAPDDVGPGAVEGEGARVVRDDAPDQR